MKKQFFAAAIILALGAGFTACSSDDLGKQEAKAVSQTGTSYMTVSFRLPAPSATRASNSDAHAGTPATGSGRYQYGSWNGKDKIESVKVYVFKEVGVLEKVHTYAENELAFNQGTSGDVKVTANNAFKITAGAKTVYIVVNPTTAVPNLPEVEGTTLANFKAKYEGSELGLTANAYPTVTDAVTKTRADEVAKVEDGKDVIMMTGAPQTINVEDGVTAQQAVAGVKNQVALTVKRVAARVLVTTATGTSEFEIKGDNPTTPAIKETQTVIAKVTKLTYTVAQGEKTLYLQVKNHTEQGQTQDKENLQTYEETPGFAYVPENSDQYWAKTNMDKYQEATEYYDYSGLWKTASSVKARTAFINDENKDQEEVGLVTEHITKADGDAGIFVLPTTHAYGSAADATKYRGANTAYVLVRGVVTPQFHVNNEGKLVAGAPTPGSTFYLGANGVAYLNQAHVQDPTKSGVVGQTAQKFVNGKVLYYVWIHPDNLAKPLNSPVDRNHIYHIQIASISKYGANWNPFVPYPKNTPELDPKTGKPKDNPTGKTPDNPNNPDDRPNDNPFEPVNPPVNPFDNLTPKETWMSVNVTILPWQVHSYQVNL